MEDTFQRLEKTLAKNGFKVKIFNNIVDIKEELLSKINLEDTVGIGGSVTIQELGIYEKLKERGNDVFWHWRKDVDSPLDKARNADIYLTSTNALTMDGKLVNMDGNGNRVASMINGHKDVFIIVGKNKICDDYGAAINRIETIAAPKNAERVNLKLPCRYIKKCIDCNSLDRMCKVETIIHRNPSHTQIHVYLVDKELGY